MTGGQGQISIEYVPVGRSGTVILTVRQGDKVLASQRLDIARPNVREAFVRDFCEKHTGFDQTERERLQEQLVEIAADVADSLREQPVADNQGEPPGEEIDISMVVRPERFITPEVSGLAIPTLIQTGGELEGRVILHLQWRDGKREARPFTSEVELPNGRRLWLHPIPCNHTDTAAPAWTQHGRKAWLDGTEAPDPAEVFKNLCERIQWLVDFPQEHQLGATALLAIYVLLTYCYPAWPAVPYLYLGGPIGSGKTRVLEVLARLAFRPIVSSNMTAPALFRTLHQQGGTLLYDEAERLKQAAPDVGEVLSVFLAGYKRGGRATRLESVGDTYKTVAFDVFGPKALACVAGLPPALSSRCIPLYMFRADKGSPKIRRRVDADPSRWQSLRDDLHGMSLSRSAAILALVEQQDVCPSMAGRDFELWQPIMALAAWLESCGASNLLGLVQDYAGRLIEDGHDDATPARDELILLALADLLKLGQTPTPKDVLSRGQENDSSMFAGYSPKGIATLLQRYGIHTRKSSGRRAYDRKAFDQLRGIERAYGFDLGLPGDEAQEVA